MSLHKCMNFLSSKLEISKYANKRTFLLELAALVLYRYDFEYQGEFFLQTNGVAMSCSFADDLANLYLDIFDNEVLKISSKIVYYCRYVDHIFGIFKGSKNEFDNFKSKVNKNFPEIKLGFESDFNKIQFLDMYIVCL